jgi:hypothetical protein
VRPKHQSQIRAVGPPRLILREDFCGLVVLSLTDQRQFGCSETRPPTPFGIGPRTGTGLQHESRKALPKRRAVLGRPTEVGEQRQLRYEIKGCH